MGEPKISVPNNVIEEGGKLCEFKYFSKNRTFVIWNMDDYPIPAGVAPLDVIRNIKSVLHQLGFPWWLIETRGFGEDPNDDIYRAGIYSCEISDPIKLTIELLNIATSRHSEASNFVVIAKLTPKSQLRRVLKSLKSRNNVVAYLELPDSEALKSIDSLSDLIHFIGGMKRPVASEDLFDLEVADAFRWTIAYRPYSEDGCCSCDWSFY